MSTEGKQGYKIFLQYWLLIAVLGAFNFYRYFTTRSTLSLLVGIGCAVAFIGWVLFFYFYYLRKPAEENSAAKSQEVTKKFDSD